MSKTTALTFAAAAVLLAASFAINIYGHHSIAAQRAAEREQEFTMYCYDCDTGLESWERTAVLTGILAIAVSFAGVLLWDRETQPEAKRSSILGLNEQMAGRIVRRVAPQSIVAGAAARIDESNARLREEESLTPLERVIRGY
ncbi:MAG: hypothetical protein QOH25_2887 [Acidobacteriota bacterium]|jgi:hypothetical protein|nr:hypothetical protein [Acidobacteriota bacterium]